MKEYDKGYNRILDVFRGNTGFLHSICNRVVYKMVINNPDGKVERWETGIEKVFFYMAFEEYVGCVNS